MGDAMEARIDSEAASASWKDQLKVCMIWTTVLQTRITVPAGQRIVHGSLAAVGIASKSNSHGWIPPLSIENSDRLYCGITIMLAAANARVKGNQRTAFANMLTQ